MTNGTEPPISICGINGTVDKRQDFEPIFDIYMITPIGVRCTYNAALPLHPVRHFE